MIACHKFLVLAILVPEVPVQERDRNIVPITSKLYDTATSSQLTHNYQVIFPTEFRPASIIAVIVIDTYCVTHDFDS